MMNGHWTSISGVDIFYGVTDIDLVMMMQDGDSICTSDCYGNHSSDSKMRITRTVTVVVVAKMMVDGDGITYIITIHHHLCYYK